LFFNGAIEAVHADVLRQKGGARVCGGTGFIASIAYERYLIEATQSYLRGLNTLSVTPPISISMGLLGCKESYMYVNPRQRPHDWHPIDRDTVILPDIVVDSFDLDVPQAMKPMFDAVWNACGFSRSLNYDQDGKWNPK
jgi:hypothetical protein